MDFNIKKEKSQLKYVTFSLIKNKKMTIPPPLLFNPANKRLCCIFIECIHNLQSCVNISKIWNIKQRTIDLGNCTYLSKEYIKFSI